jgi:hypothetical protein
MEGVLMVFGGGVVRVRAQRASRVKQQQSHWNK